MLASQRANDLGGVNVLEGANVLAVANDQAESQKPPRCVGIADRKVFARQESFCEYLQNWLEDEGQSVVCIFAYIALIRKF